MKVALEWLASLFLALCVGTVLSLTVIGGMLWWKGVFQDERWLAMLAALHGIQPAAVVEPQPDPVDDEQPSYEQIAEQRLAASLDLELRETSIDKTLGELRNLETQIRTEREWLDRWKLSFDQRLATLETKATEESLLQLQRTMESMNPKQAKDQIMRMLEASPTRPEDDPLRDVVTILKTMPADKQRKIIGEFKLEDEQERLAEILRQIRLGTPDSDLLRDTRNQLQQQPIQR
ncbi:MAG: hypothetical protein MUF06_03210 [Pirellulaceae bacterium]|jgi:hypothetical protein|nr:hypothetical protein [Pirellulaceae bacterium]